MRIGNLFLLLTALILAAPNYASAEDDDLYDGGSGNIVIEEEEGNIRILLPKSAAGSNKAPSPDDRSKLVPSGNGLLDKATGTYYEPAGAKGYRNRKTGEYEKAWTCYPRP